VQLRFGHLANAVQGNVAKLGQTPLVVVAGRARGAKVRAATDALAKILVAALGLREHEDQLLSAQLASDDKSLEAIERGAQLESLSLTEKLLLQLRLTQVQTIGRSRAAAHRAERRGAQI